MGIKLRSHVALLAFLTIAGLLHGCEAVTYNKPHNLIVDGQTSGSLIINQPTGYVIVRNSRLTSTFRIDGYSSTYNKDPPYELTILAEDITVLGSMQFRYLNLDGNSSITYRNIIGSGNNAVTSITYNIFDNVPIIFSNISWQRYFFFRYATLNNGSTFLAEYLTLPRGGEVQNMGYFRFQVINAKGRASLTVNRAHMSFFELSSSAFYDADLFINNSVVESDGLCVKKNCHFNVSTTVMNHGTFAITDSVFPNASLRVTSLTAQNRTNFLVRNCHVEADEISTVRYRYAVIFSSGTSFESATQVLMDNVTLDLSHATGISKLIAARAFYSSASFRQSSLTVQKCDIKAVRSDTLNGNAIYFLAFTDSSLSIDAYTFNSITNGNVLLYGVGGLTAPFDLTGVYNAKLAMYIRGPLGQSIIANGVRLVRLELQNFFLDGPASVVNVTDSYINTLEFDQNAVVQNGAQVIVSGTTAPNLYFNSFSALTGSSVTITGVTVNNFNWPSGEMKTGVTLTVADSAINHAIEFQQQITGSKCTIMNCAIKYGVSFNGINILRSSEISLLNNSIVNDLKLTTTGTSTGIAFRSGSLRESTLIIANNTVRATFVNTNTPTPTDLAYGIFLEATMQVSGTSTVAYLYNTITSTQNGVPGVSILHEAVTRTSVPLSYQPPVPLTPSTTFVGRDVVEFRLDGNSTLTIDWCTMWDVASLRLKLYGGGADRPFVLDGADARGVGDLTLDCGGGAGAMPVYVTNSRFASLTLTRCSVTGATPFVLEDVHVNGTLTWGPTGVSNAAAALLFNATVAGGVVEPLAHTGVLPPSNVTRPPVLHLERYADAARWNAEVCFGDAPPFSYTPSATASDGTPTPSNTLQPTPSETLPPTPSRTRSRTVVATETATAPLSATLSATSTGVLTETVSMAATLSSDRTVTHEASPTGSLTPTTSITRSGTVAPPTRSPSVSYTPPATATRTASATVSVAPCDGAPVVNGTAAATTEDALTDAPHVFALHVGTAVMYAAAVHAPSSNHGGGDEAEVVLNASMYRAVWVRESDSLPSDLAGEGVLPASAVELAVVGSTNSSSSSTPSPTASRDALGWLRLRLDLTRLASESGGARFDEVFPTAVRLELEPAFFAARHCGYRVVAGVVLIEASSSMLLDAANGLLQGVGDVAAVGGIVAGGGTAGDAVSLAILADMGCARPVVKESGHNQRLLSPAAFDASVPGMLYGSLLLCAVFPLVHVAVTLGYAHRIGALRTTPLVAMARLRFPSWTFGVLMYLHQGVTYLSLKILFAPPPDEEITGGAKAAAVFGLLYALLAPPSFVLVAARYIDATFVEYDFPATAEESRPGALWQRILPMGRWEVREVRSAYGVMLSPLRRAHPMWAAFAFASPSLVAVVAVARPTSAAGCAHQYAWMCCVLAGYGVLAYVYRPYRAAVNNGLCAVSTGSLFGIAAMSLVQAGAGGAVNVRATSALTFVCVMLQMVTTFLRVAYIVFLSFNERVRTAGVVMHARLRRSPDDVWLAFPCLGWCSGTFALKRMRAEQKRVREESKFEKEYVIPPPMVVAAPKAELEKPLLPPAEKPQDPAVLANCHIIDVTQLEDCDALLEQKAAPDRLHGDKSGSVDHSWSVTDGPTASDLGVIKTESREAEKTSVDMENSSRFTLPIPVDASLHSRSGTENGDDTATKEEPTSTGSFAPPPMDASLHPEYQPLPPQLQPGKRVPIDDPRKDSVFRLLGSISIDAQQNLPKRRYQREKEDSRNSMIVDADFGALPDTRRRSVSYGASATNSLFVEPRLFAGSPVEMETKPRSRTLPPEPNASQYDDPLHFSWAQTDSSADASNEEAAAKPSAEPSVVEQPAADEEEPSPAPRKRVNTQPPVEPESSQDAQRKPSSKRTSIFDVAPFDPRNSRARTLPPAPTPHDSSSSQQKKKPSDKKNSDTSSTPPKRPPLASLLPDSPEEKKAKHLSESSEWVMADKFEAQLLQVPKQDAPKGRRRRSMSVDYVWSNSGTPSMSTAAPPDASMSAEPMMNPLMATATEVRRGSRRLPSIHQMLPAAARRDLPPTKEVIKSKKPAFGMSENRRISRALSFSL